MAIESRKYRLIEKVMQISDETFLSNLENMFKKYIESTNSISYLVKPMREKLDINLLIKEQNYKGADKKIIDSLIDDMAIEEPLVDLLKMI